MNFSQNQEYKNLLSGTAKDFYHRYINDVLNLKKEGKKKFLDCGCGTGNVIRNLVDKENNYGMDVSEFFIEELKKDGYNVLNYEGTTFPYPDNFFDIAGSFTVLEHVENPEFFIMEQMRVLKTGGYLIIACPNFLSVFNTVRSYSLFYKFKLLINQYVKKSTNFIKMNPIIRDCGKFVSDDDAIVLTNPIQLRNFLKSHKFQIIEFSSFMSKRGLIYSILSRIPFLRYVFPSCYFLCRKIK